MHGPTAPRSDTEAALFAECWDAVLSYADLCADGAGAAAELAREAFAQGIREIRAAETGTVRGTGRRSSRLPRIPLLLTAVRTTAAAWEDSGRGGKLAPDLRLWLNSGQAARYTGPPLSRPVALRALRDLQQADAELLWLAEVEALPLPLAARRLGLDPATVPGELAQVRDRFRNRCRSNHLDSPMRDDCRGYARLLDAVTRSPAADAPDDLSRHLATCAPCAEAAACLRPHGTAVPGALAAGVLGWGGPAYLERRRRAADARLGAGGRDRDTAAGARHDDPADGTQPGRVARNGLLVAAVLVSGLALAASLIPFGGDPAGERVAAEANRRAVAEPGVSLPDGTLPDAPSSAAAPSSRRASSGAPSADRADGDHPSREKPGPEPQGTSSAGTAPAPGTSAVRAACRVAYQLNHQWLDGFQSTVTVTTDRALDSWRVGFSFPDGQQVRQMWDAEVTQAGGRITATGRDYNRAVPAGGTFTFGFIGSWHGSNGPPSDFTLNGRPCTTA